MKFERARTTTGILLMAGSLLAGFLMPLAAAAAEGDPKDVPEEREVAETAREAYWNGDPSDYGKNAITKQYPPEAVCLVQPQFCSFPEDDSPQGQLGGVGNDLNDGINTGVQDGTTAVQENDPGPPADPVPPNTLPVSIAFGQANYRSAVEFELPQVPSGQEVDSFTVFLEQGNPTYHNSSPALRQAVLAALTCARENEEPQGRCTRAEFEKVAMENCDEEVKETPEPCLREDEPLLVEMCPIVESEATPVDDTQWEEGPSQDEETLPAVDCLYGDLGTQYPGVTVTREDGSTEQVTLWGFDLSFALQAWESGELPYAGVELRPGSAENFAYGDPDSSYSKQVTFQNTVQYALATREPPPPPPSFDAPAFDTGGSFDSSSGSGGGDDLFGTPPQPASDSPISNTSVTPDPISEQPAVAEDTAVSEGTGEQTPTLAANSPLGEPVTPWWSWLLILPFLAGAWLLQQSLAAEVAVATERNGAMTRLLERQAAERAPDLVN